MTQEWRSPEYVPAVRAVAERFEVGGSGPRVEELLLVARVAASEPLRPVDLLKAGVALSQFLDGAEHFLALFQETFGLPPVLSGSSLSGAGDPDWFDLLSAEIWHSGGVTWFNAVELLAEATAARVHLRLNSGSLPWPPGGAEAPPPADAGARLDLPWLDEPERLQARLAELVPEATGLPRSEVTDATAAALTEVACLLPRVVAALVALGDAAAARREDEWETLGPQLLALDAFIARLAELAAAFARWSSIEEAFYSALHRLRSATAAP